MIMPLLLTQSRRVDVVTEQQKLYQSDDRWNHHLFTIMSKAGSFVNGSLEESHSYDYRNEEKGN